MEKHRITKYDPKNRNDQGHYLYDHWTEISDVGKTLEGELVTKEEYLRIENDYINAVVEILKDSKQEYLRLVGFNQERYQESITDNSNKWFHDVTFENLNLFEDKKVSLEEIPIVIKLNLRRYIDTSLEIMNKYYVQFGYDFYMYVGSPELSNLVMDKLNSTSVFIEEFWSPYDARELEYVVQTSKKTSMHVVQEQILKSFTIENMKKIFNLSNEHPGKIYEVINREIADKIGIKVDLDKYDYYLTTELKLE